MTRHLVLGAAAVLLTLWSYQSVRSADWVYEDRATQTSAQSASWQRVVTHWTWRMASTPTAGHLVNLAVHLVLGWLLGVVAWRLGLTPFGAWIVALVWLLHPMTVETAAYAKARSEQIVMLGTLTAMLAATGQWWRPVTLLGIAAGIAIALGGEPSGVVAFLLVPLTAWHCRDRYWRERPMWAPWWLCALVAGTLIWGGILWYGGLMAVINVDTEAGLAVVTQVTWIQWLLAQSGAVWYWLMATVVPALLTPDADIDRLSALARGLGLFAMVVAGGIAWRVRRTHPMVTMAASMWLLALFPRLLVQTPRSYLGAAQFSLAFMGLAMLAGYGTERWRDRWQAAS